MLDELTVKGFGIIEEVTWRPGEGLNVITGETGAGKSLVVDAVEALMSGQVLEEDIRHGSAEARIEGIFRIDSRENTSLRELLTEKGLDGGDDTLLLTCDFRRQGRTTPRVNRQAVSRTLLREIGDALVDIHGQSDHLSLLDRQRHLDFLDAGARNRDLRQEFGAMAARLRQVEADIGGLRRQQQDSERRRELLEFQVDEIRRAELVEGEEEEHDRQLLLLTSAEKLKAAAYEVHRQIYGADGSEGASAVDRISEALPALKNIADTDPSLQPGFAYLQETLYGLQELAREIRTYADNLEYDPQQLEEVQDRLELIRSLKRKYGGSITAILAFLDRAQAELEGFTNAGERSEELEAERIRLRTELGVLAYQLSRRRREAADKLAVSVKKELTDLEMTQVEFGIDISNEPSPEGIPFPDGKTYRFDATGADTVVFLASTNPGEPPKPLERIASTGEMSRFLLALKSALAGADTVPVLIFDEIDIGVGGRSGEVVGRKLWNLSRNHQVICVTHLPQIAAFADVHFNVTKQSAGDRTVSTITRLDEEARRREIAVMLGGAEYTANALQAAAELIAKAGGWKKR